LNGPFVYITINYMSENEEKLSFPEKEEKILEFWGKNKIFERSVEQRKGKKKFVCYEGPPYANGRPGIHHVEARAFKDIILRYKTMRGFQVPRRAGWDTHGLPTEMEVEKKLGIKSKKEIEEKIGIEKFAEEARQNVFLYKEEWEKLTERMAYWLDMENAYVTMTNNYMETLWWIFKEIDKRKLLYEDYKIVPWCPRCGTALSSHEVSQGYRKIKEDSIYIKFKVKSRDPDWQNTSFLVWTTTPWTLPNNVALAINPDIEYICVPDPEEERHWLVLGKKNFEILLEKGFFPESYKNLESSKIDVFSGREMVGLEYEPLYPNKAPYKVYPADFVSAEDGTGIVHIAPAFGEDDMNLGKKENLPVLSLVNEEGEMLTPGYKWDEMFIKDADPLIMEDLRARNLLFKTEAYEHDYPFCWRCESPLMYYAKTSWWLKSTAVKQKMIRENKKIHWHPEYLKSGRFGEWLNELRDWAISRERYWGTPLPIWRCEKCKKYKVVGSVDELKKLTSKSGNKYFVMRHGFSDANQKVINNSNVNNNGYKLTSKGRKEILKSSQKLKKQKIDLIFSSDFLRTKETAFLAAETFGISKENVIFDERLREVNTGIFDGKSRAEYHKYFSSLLEKFTKTPPQGENLTKLKERITKFLYELEGKYKGKNILIVSHEYPIWMLETGAMGWTDEESAALKEKKNDYIKTGEVKKIDFIPLPHDKNFVLDLHRPYIDKILLRCDKCGQNIERVKEVADVWFDSGSMPFAQNHYPFEKKLDYPADYICEAIDQTRGWFFTLLAVAVLLGKGAPYKNVLSLGLVLDAQGQKMSKSRGNVVEPVDLMKKYGADAVRWYFFTINQPWDEKLFKEEDVAAVLRRFILIFWNCFTYFNTYQKSPPKADQPRAEKSKLIINKWLIARFNQIVSEVTKLLDNYDIVPAARLIEDFVIDDISHWYIRRIRDIMKNHKSKEAKETGAVLGYVLLNTAKLLSPFMPFISETVYKELGGKKKSVHLEDWPVIKKESKISQDKFLENMDIIEDIISSALRGRSLVGIKIRQPLAELRLGEGYEIIATFSNSEEYLNIIKGETNIKKISFIRDVGKPDKNWFYCTDPNLRDVPGMDIYLNSEITPELKEEGILRDLIREMQDFRKKEGLKPGQMVEFYISTDAPGKNFLVKYAEELKKATSAKSLIIKPSLESGSDIKSGEFNFRVKI
jgi:isoleucyl-tRNA synthetase